MTVRAQFRKERGRLFREETDRWAALVSGEIVYVARAYGVARPRPEGSFDLVRALIERATCEAYYGEPARKSVPWWKEWRA